MCRRTRRPGGGGRRRVRTAARPARAAGDPSEQRPPVAHVLEHLDRDDAIEAPSEGPAWLTSGRDHAEAIWKPAGPVAQRLDPGSLRSGVGNGDDLSGRGSARRSKATIEPQPQPRSSTLMPSSIPPAPHERASIASSAAARSPTSSPPPAGRILQPADRGTARRTRPEARSAVRWRSPRTPATGPRCASVRPARPDAAPALRLPPRCSRRRRASAPTREPRRSSGSASTPCSSARSSSPYLALFNTLIKALLRGSVGFGSLPPSPDRRHATRIVAGAVSGPRPVRRVALSEPLPRASRRALDMQTLYV